MRGIVKKIAVILLATIVLAGCGANESSGNSVSNVEIGDGIELSEEIENTDTTGDIADGTFSDADYSSDENARKIIFTYKYEIETKDLDQSVNAIEKAVEEAGGYYEESNINGNTTKGGYASYVLRIPTDKLGAFIDGIGTFGNIIRQSKNGQDITSQYYDIESRLSSLKIQQERILELLKQADSLDDILKLETELTKVRNSIENLTTNLKKYDSLIDYTTVNITVDQVLDYTDNNENFGSTIVETFVDSFEFALGMLKMAIIVLIWLLPYIIIIGLIVTVAVVLDKKNRKKHAARYSNHPPVQSMPNGASMAAHMMPGQPMQPMNQHEIQAKNDDNK